MELNRDQRLLGYAQISYLDHSGIAFSGGVLDDIVA